MARPTDLTPQLQEEICGYVAEGMSRTGACALAGISRSTLHNWTKWGEEDRQPYAAFLDAFARAEAEAERDSLEVWRKPKQGQDWRAAQSFLAHRFADKYSEKRVIQHEGGEKPLQLASVTDDQLATMVKEQADRLAKLVGGEDA